MKDDNSRLSTLLAVAGLLAVACLLAGVIAGAVDWLAAFPARQPAAVGPAGQEVAPRKGELAPDFTLVDLDGNQVSLSDFRGRPVLINFWAGWCPPCRREMPDIVAAYEQHKEEELVVLAVNVQEPEAEVRDFAVEAKMSFPVLPDSDGAVANLYGVRSLPTNFFINKDGVIAHIFYGGMTRDVLERFLGKILND
jgi:peroxiredoxin